MMPAIRRSPHSFFRPYIAGDSDREKVPNVGRIKAEEAAAAIGGKALFPLFPDGVKGTDWNDLAKAVGRETAQIWLQCAVRVAERQTEPAKTATPAIQRTPGKQAAREPADLER